MSTDWNDVIEEHETNVREAGKDGPEDWDRMSGYVLPTCGCEIVLGMATRAEDDRPQPGGMLVWHTPDGEELQVHLGAHQMAAIAFDLMCGIATVATESMSEEEREAYFGPALTRMFDDQAVELFQMAAARVHTIARRWEKARRAAGLGAELPPLSMDDFLRDLGLDPGQTREEGNDDA